MSLNQEGRLGEFHHRDSLGDWYFGLQTPPGDPLPGYEPTGWVHIRFVPIGSCPPVTAIMGLETWESIVDHIRQVKERKHSAIGDSKTSPESLDPTITDSTTPDRRNYGDDQALADTGFSS